MNLLLSSFIIPGVSINLIPTFPFFKVYCVELYVTDSRIASSCETNLLKTLFIKELFPALDSPINKILHSIKHLGSNKYLKVPSNSKKYFIFSITKEQIVIPKLNIFSSLLQLM